jgi:hypothetical protein
MHKASVVAAATMAVLVSGCYHATVDTGLRPSGEVVERDWAHGFLYGLVPPSDVDVASECPNGVAQVDTELSFLNQVAIILTGGLYTPMSIRVACAVGPDRAAAVEIPAGADPVTVRHAIAQAAQVSHESGKPAFVRFVD